MGGEPEPQCPRERRSTCQSEWVELRSDLKHIKETVDKLDTMLQGNGGVGIRVQVDRSTRTLAAMIWVVGAVVLVWIGEKAKAMFGAN